MAYRPTPPRLYAPRRLRNIATPNPFHQVAPTNPFHQVAPTNPFHQVPPQQAPNPFQQIPQAPAPWTINPQQAPFVGGNQQRAQGPWPGPNVDPNTMTDVQPGTYDPRRYDSLAQAMEQRQHGALQSAQASIGNWQSRIAAMAHHLAPGETLFRARHQLQQFTANNDGTKGPAEQALAFHHLNVTDAHTAASRLARMLGQTRIAPGMRRGTGGGAQGAPNGYAQLMSQSGVSGGYGQQGRAV